MWVRGREGKGGKYFVGGGEEGGEEGGREGGREGGGGRWRYGRRKEFYAVERWSEALGRAVQGERTGGGGKR